MGLPAQRLIFGESLENFLVNFSAKFEQKTFLFGGYQRSGQSLANLLGNFSAENASAAVNLLLNLTEKFSVKFQSSL